MNIDLELSYLEKEGFAFSCALLTGILREDHFCNGSMKKRIDKGHITAVLNRMIETID